MMWSYANRQGPASLGLAKSAALVAKSGLTPLRAIPGGRVLAAMQGERRRDRAPGGAGSAAGRPGTHARRAPGTHARRPGVSLSLRQVRRSARIPVPTGPLVLTCPRGARTFRWASGTTLHPRAPQLQGSCAWVLRRLKKPDSVSPFSPPPTLQGTPRRRLFCGFLPSFLLQIHSPPAPHPGSSLSAPSWAHLTKDLLPASLLAGLSSHRQSPGELA